MRHFIAAGFVAMLIGCASGHSQFYTDYAGRWPVLSSSPRSSPVAYTGSGDPERDVDLMYQQGYALVGYSSFNGPFDPTGAIAQARKVGAERVIQYSAHTGTVQGAVPLTTSQAVTTYSSGRVSAFGSGGYATGVYSGAGTTYVPTTSYIPYAIERYDQSALYFAPLGPPCFGSLLQEATDSQKRAAGSNSIAVVTAVRNNSPAFEANILPGDIIVSADGMRVRDLGVTGEPGRVVTVGILRAGSAALKQPQRLSVQVTLGPGCRT